FLFRGNECRNNACHLLLSLNYSDYEQIENHLLRAVRSLMMGSTYLAGPATPITGVAASNLFFAQ
ncbi:MAG: hypothetical protein ACKO96_45000, partial [Flammeovirgaceae bacterium]